MNEKYLELLNEIMEEEDDNKRKKLIRKALEIDSNNSQALLLAAENEDDPYERLSLLDRSITSSQKELMALGFLSEEFIGNFQSFEEGDWYLSSIILRMLTLIEVNYIFQAKADLEEVLFLDQHDTHNLKSLGFLLALQTEDLHYAVKLLDDRPDFDLNIDIPFAVLLYNTGNTEESLTIFRHHMDFTENFTKFVEAIYINDDISELDIDKENIELLDMLLDVKPFVQMNMLKELQFV